DRLDHAVLRAAEGTARELGIALHVIDDRGRIERLAATVATTTRSRLGNSAHAAELRDWTRRGDDRPTGVDPGPLLGLLVARGPRLGLVDAGLAAALARRSERAVRRSAALLLLE